MNDIQNALTIFEHAIAAVDPAALIRRHIRWENGGLIINDGKVSLTPQSRIFVIGAGKASAIMAQTIEDILGNNIEAGIVVTKHGHGLSLQRIKLIEAGHPVPDNNSLEASGEILQLLEALAPSDLVLFLLSGGASSLLADCPPGSNLREIQEVYEALLGSGAGIHEMNRVRKHLSRVKGGQLAKRIYPTPLYSLILSDVIGDDLDVIGSGPTVPDRSSFRDAWDVLTKYGMEDKIPLSVSGHIRDGMAGKISDTPKPDEEYFANTSNCIIGNNQVALKAAALHAEALGYKTHIVTHVLEGEARDLGPMLVAKARDYKGPLPACFLYGGESTVTIKGKGTGGRNQELALAAGIALGSHRDITVLSGGTDGTDGPTDAAGAVVNAEIMNKARELRYDPITFLDDNDSYNFFSHANGLVKTGATHTNVMDIIILLINKPTLN